MSTKTDHGPQPRKDVFDKSFVMARAHGLIWLTFRRTYDDPYLDQKLTKFSSISVYQRPSKDKSDTKYET